MNGNSPSRLLTVDELANLLRVPRSWVYSHTRDRTESPIPHVKLGKYVRFRQADVLAWLHSQQAGGDHAS